MNLKGEPAYVGRHCGSNRYEVTPELVAPPEQHGRHHERQPQPEPAAGLPRVRDVDRRHRGRQGHGLAEHEREHDAVVRRGHHHRQDQQRAEEARPRQAGPVQTAYNTDQLMDLVKGTGGFDLGVVQGAFGVVLELGGHDIGRGRILHRLDTVAAVDTFKRRYGA